MSLNFFIIKFLSRFSFSREEWKSNRKNDHTYNSCDTVSYTHLDVYKRQLHIEAGTLVEIIQKDLLPAVTTYMEKLAQTAALKKSVVPDISVSTEAKLLTKLTELSEAMKMCIRDSFRVFLRRFYEATE